MFFKSATSKNTFAIAGCGLIATAAASGAMFYFAFQTIEKASLEEMRKFAQATALQQEKVISQATGIVDGLATSLTGMKANGFADRAHADILVRDLLRDNPLALGVWTGWEPNAFDGKDSAFANAEGHDATGRYVPYLVRNGDKIDHVPLVDYAVSGAGDYYQLPFNQKKPVVIEPYIYPVAGQNVLMTSIAKPITVNGRVLGVAGLDLSLNDTDKAISAIRPMETGTLSVITAAGNIVSHPKKELIGKNIKEGGAATAGWEGLISKPTTVLEGKDAEGRDLLSVAYPIALNGEQNWYAVVSVPEATVFAALNDMAFIGLLITLGACVILALFGWAMTRKFVRRIDNVVRETDLIASGQFELDLADRDSQDEIGQLSRSLAILAENNRQRIELERQATLQRTQSEDQHQRTMEQEQRRAAEMAQATTGLAQGLSHLSSGNLSFELTEAFAAEFEGLRADFNKTVQQLRNTLTSVAESTDAIDNGSKEISHSANDLSKRTEQQAASLEETAAALDQITANVTSSSNRAEEARKAALEANESARQSGVVVASTADAMRKIEQASSQIANIIGVIDEIAFQTNLLALNAGVEAARAGEAGKGFAVVAQEVRELAQRSANAAKEIKSLIRKSENEVSNGVKLVNDTVGVLKKIENDIAAINQHMDAIATSAREQSIGLSEVNTSVNQMDHVTQQNAAMVEEANAAGVSLASEATRLRELVNGFDLGRQQNRTVVARPAVAASADIQSYASPARQMLGKLTKAVTGRGLSSTNAAKWEEF